MDRQSSKLLFRPSPHSYNLRCYRNFSIVLLHNILHAITVERLLPGAINEKPWPLTCGVVMRLFHTLGGVFFAWHASTLLWPKRSTALEKIRVREMESRSTVFTSLFVSTTLWKSHDESVRLRFSRIKYEISVILVYIRMSKIPSNIFSSSSHSESSDQLLIFSSSRSLV
jgi:hypothetical protein